MKTLIYSIMLALFFSFMIGCKSKTVYVPVETIRKEKEFVDRWSRDSIHLHDSIYVERKGDTLWLEKYKTIYKEKLVRDSIFVTDSVSVEVPYPVVEVKEVNRLRNWQIILMCLGGVLVGCVGWRVLRWIR